MTSLKRTCNFPGCDRPFVAKGFCSCHWQQHRRGVKMTSANETQRADGTPPRINYEERPCPKPHLEGPCHVYKHPAGGKGRDGYGSVKINGKSVFVHCYVWEQTHGKPPDGMMIDHQCQVRACCNIKHLRLVTPQINSTENVSGHTWQLQKAKTHCIHGHEYTLENTGQQNEGRRRYCRTCKRKQLRDRYLQSKGS